MSNSIQNKLQDTRFFTICANIVDSDSLFVCFEVLRPSQPNGVMLSTVSLPSHMFTGQA